MPSVMEILIKAQDSASAVLDKVGGAGEESGGKIKEAWNTAAVAVSAAGVALEGLARAQEDTTFAVDKLSIRSGVNADTLRAWGLEISGANDNILEMTQLMDLANRRGLEGKDSLQKYALFWDTISDATGESSTELAKAGVSLAAVGVEAGNEGDAMAALGYISNNTTSSISEFLGFVGRTGPKLREMGIGVNDSAALLGILQNELGMTGRTAIGQFNTAVNSSNGDMNKLLDTLGISADMLDTYRGKVADSADILDKQAAAFDNTRTPIEHLQMLFGNLTSQFGGVIGGAAQLAPVLMAMGPIMWGLSYATSGLAAAKLFLAGAIGMVNVALLFLAANPIILVIAAIGLAVVALAFAFQNNFFGIRDIMQSVAGTIIDIAKGIVGTFLDLAGTLVGVAAGIPGPWQDAAKGLQKTLDDTRASVDKWGIGTAQSVADAKPPVAAAAKDTLGVIPAAATSAATTTKTVVKDMLGDLVKQTKDARSALASVWSDAAATTLSAQTIALREESALADIADTQKQLADKVAWKKLSVQQKDALQEQLITQRAAYVALQVEDAAYGTDTERRAKLTGLLQSKALLDGLNSSNNATVLYWQKVAADTQTAIDVLNGIMNTGGKNAAAGWWVSFNAKYKASSITADWWTKVPAVQYIAPGTWTKPIQAYASGAWNVASDMLAYIHQGEMVVPAVTATTMRAAAVGGFSGGFSGGSGGFSGPLVYINNYSGGEKEDERLARMIERRTRRR